MPKPTNKEELLQACRTNYDKLIRYINTLSKEEQELDFPEGTLNRNIRDVLGHLHHWHLMFLNWYVVGMKGDKPDMPAKGYTWKTIKSLNESIQKMYSSKSLQEVKDLLDQSYGEVTLLIEAHTNEELFEKKHYKWTGSTSLGVYLISNTSSHYNWGYQLIRKSC